MTATPVKTAALQAGLRVFAPERLDDSILCEVGSLRPDLLACVSYGKILPQRLLEAPALAALNVHPSLLPAYRGAAPIQAALRDGRSSSGVSVIWMTPQMDAGDIALAREVSIDERDTYGTLHHRLAVLAAELLAEAVEQLACGRLGRQPQDHSRATYTRLIGKHELQLDFTQPTKDIVNQIRSASPRPGAWVMLDHRRLKVLEARAERRAPEGRRPGEVLEYAGDGPLIATLDGSIRILRVVPEGKPEMSGADLARNKARTGARKLE